MFEDVTTPRTEDAYFEKGGFNCLSRHNIIMKLKYQCVVVGKHEIRARMLLLLRIQPLFPSECNIVQFTFSVEYFMLQLKGLLTLVPNIARKNEN